MCCSEPRTLVLCPGPRPGATCVLRVRSLSPQGAGPERPLFGHQGLLSRKLLIPRARRAVRELSTELHSRSSTLRAQRCPPPNPTTSGGPGAPPHGLPLTCCLSRPAVRSPRPQVDAPGVTLQAVPACPRILPRPRSTQSPLPRSTSSPCRTLRPTDDSPEVQYDQQTAGGRDAWVSGTPTWPLHSQSGRARCRSLAPSSAPQARAFGPRSSVLWGPRCALALTPRSLSSGRIFHVLLLMFYPLLAAILKENAK